MNWLQQPASATQITHQNRLWLYCLGFLVMFFLLAPTLIVIPMSFSESQYLEFPPRQWSLRWYQHYFDSPEWLAATTTSFKAAFLTLLVATPLGTLAAYGLHVSRFKFGNAIFLILVSPMMIPVVLIGIGIFYIYAQIKLNNTILGLVLAHTIHAMPLVVIVVSSGLKSYDMSQETAARSLGASRARAFMLVTLPQIRFSVITAALLSFLSSFDEIIIALFISGGQHETLTRRMFSALRDQIDPTIASISTLMILLSCALLMLVQIFGKDKTAG